MHCSGRQAARGKGSGSAPQRRFEKLLAAACDAGSANAAAFPCNALIDTMLRSIGTKHSPSLSMIDIDGTASPSHDSE
jgi:hypothetical protein